MWLRTTFQSVFDYSNQLFYWEGPRSRQLNFAVRLNKYLPVEVKYQHRISSDDAKPIIDFQKGRKIYQWAHTHKGHSCHEKLTSGSSRPPRASAYLEFASKGGSIPGNSIFFPTSQTLVWGRPWAHLCQKCSNFRIGTQASDS